MMKNLYFLLALLAAVLVPGVARAATCPSFPYIFTNGVTFDANQLMADLNLLLSCAQGNQPASPPTTVYVKLGGTATGASCFNPATPCGTIVPDAVNAAATVVQGINPVVISVGDSGPYLGGTIAYASTARGALTTSTLGYPWLEILGTAAPVVITTNPSEMGCVICVTNYTSMYLNNVTLQATSGTEFDVTFDGFSHIRFNNVTIDNNTNHVTVVSMIEAASTSNAEIGGTVTLEGSTDVAIEAEDNATVQFLSGTTIVCGANFSYSADFMFSNHGLINTQATVPLTYSGCPTSGVAMQLNGGALWKRNSLSDDILAGNSYRFNSSDSVTPSFQYAPTAVSSCTNGTLRTGSSNYSIEVDFSGPSTACTVTFGKPSSFSSYWTNEPTCTTSSNVTAFSRNTTIAIADGTFGSSSPLILNCQPFFGG